MYRYENKVPSERRQELRKRAILLALTNPYVANMTEYKLMRGALYGALLWGETHVLQK